MTTTSPEFTVRSPISTVASKRRPILTALDGSQPGLEGLEVETLAGVAAAEFFEIGRRPTARGGEDIQGVAGHASFGPRADLGADQVFLSEHGSVSARGDRLGEHLLQDVHL
ncbi:hypothetical protein [Streptomyces adustus]|uniref:hypothetical protein n=1 Tax=Streptomyces adustus TaxID=1609272 RepID=UPI00370FD1BA